jgi:isopentenyl-diphosphate Delta-isomerase
MAEEYIDILDEKGNKIGLTESKRIAHEKGLWHLAVHIWVYNSKGEILIQHRCKEKRSHPNMWDVSVGGHVSAGESAIESALRELDEEIGLKARKEDLDFYGRKKASVIVDEKFHNNEFYEIYLLRKERKFEFRLQKEEVDKVNWIDADSLKQDIIKHPDKYVPHGDYWFEMIEDIKKISIKKFLG